MLGNRGVNPRSRKEKAVKKNVIAYAVNPNPKQAKWGLEHSKSTGIRNNVQKQQYSRAINKHNDLWGGDAYPFLLRDSILLGPHSHLVARLSLYLPS